MIQDDRLLHAWLLEGPETGPIDGLERTLEVVHRTRQRPAWSFAGRWIPWLAPMASARAGLVGLAAIIALALLLLAVATALLLGSQRRLPPPVGPAGNGILAYDTGRGGIIYVTDRDGKNAHPLIGDFGVQRAPAFSPDGTKIAFWRRADDPATNPSPADGCGCRYELWIADADGSHLHRASGDLQIDTIPDTRPSWSPDGSRLAFYSADEGIERLFVVQEDGSAPPSPITDTDASRMNPVWSPDGQWIAFRKITDDSPPIASVAVIRPDGTDQRIFGRQALPDQAGAFADSIEWAPDSTRIVYIRGADDAEPSDQQYAAYLDAIDITTGERTNVYFEPSGFMHHVEWSPDGASLAFLTGELADALRIAHFDGTPTDLLERCAGMRDSWLGWAPDGKSLLGFCEGIPERIPVDDPAGIEVVDLPPGATLIDQQRVAE